MIKKTIKKPIVVLTDTYEIFCEHSCAGEASEFWGIPKSTIKAASRNNWLVPIQTGHIFIYKDLYEGILAVEAA